MNRVIFEEIRLDAQHAIYLTKPIKEFNWDYEKLMGLWDTHPEEYHKIQMRGKEVLTPRWQQSYGKNYRYSGSKNNALPITEDLQLFLDWSRRHIDERLNGLLLNWYDGQKGHYIGAHRDDTRDLQPESPIVTISLGQERIFRMRRFRETGYQDFVMRHGTVITIPWETNKHWTHEVPKFKKYNDKRISVTLRAYT